MSTDIIPFRDVIFMGCTYSVPLFDKEGLGEILLDKSSRPPRFALPPLFQRRRAKRGGLNTYYELTAT